MLSIVTVLPKHYNVSHNVLNITKKHSPYQQTSYYTVPMTIFPYLFQVTMNQNEI